MTTIGYHEHIVNLQGLSIVEGGTNLVSEVNRHLYPIPMDNLSNGSKKKNFNVKVLLHFQLSLVLEYCSFGDLKSYLKKHNQEFKQTILHKDNREQMPLHGNTKHNLAQLEIWSYQVQNTHYKQHWPSLPFFISGM